MLVVLIDGLSTNVSPGSLLVPAVTSFSPKSWKEIGLASGNSSNLIVGLMFAGLNAHAGKLLELIKAFPTIFAQMAKPSKFAFSMKTAYSFVCVLYAIIGSIGYVPC